VPSTPTSIRTLAAQLGLSKTVVSDALNAMPGVSKTTALRVQRAAAAAGYRQNPLTSAVMSKMRRKSGPGRVCGTLAVLSVHEPGRPVGATPFNQAVRDGARQRARELGFNLEEFCLGHEGLTPRRLDEILRWRGIRGLLLLPVWETPDFGSFGWADYAVIYADYPSRVSMFHAVCSDHHASIVTTLHRVAGLGFRRPGFFILRQANRRLHYRWSGAFAGYQLDHPELGAIPPLLLEDYDRELFQQWFRRHQPDVVLGHHPVVVEWMEECGAEVPSRHGFVCLNSFSPGPPSAGLDLQPALIGARSAEIVIGQLLRNESGLPPSPTLTCVPARWIDGPTLRTQPPEATS
jgi:LacI family transcriptional regulator